MLQNLKKQVIFANPSTLKPTMETIILSYEPGSDFAVALEELIRNSEGVRVVKRRKRKGSVGDLIEEIAKNAPNDIPLTDEDIQQEVNSVRYCL